MGGTLAAIEQGFIQTEIQNAAYAFQQSVERGEGVVVGVNKFRLAEENPPVTFRMDPALERSQIERLRDLRASRAAPAVERPLNAPGRGSRASANHMTRSQPACAAYATGGE